MSTDICRRCGSPFDYVMNGFYIGVCSNDNCGFNQDGEDYFTLEFPFNKENFNIKLILDPGAHITSWYITWCSDYTSIFLGQYIPKTPSSDWPVDGCEFKFEPGIITYNVDTTELEKRLVKLIILK